MSNGKIPIASPRAFQVPTGTSSIFFYQAVSREKNPMKAFARFVVREPPKSLPAMIGNRSTSSLPLETWDDFWGKIAAKRIQRNPLIRLQLFCLLLVFCWSVYLVHLIWTSNINVYVFFPTLWTSFVLWHVLCGSIDSFFLSGVQKVCSEFSASFGSAGFSLSCQMEGIHGNYVIYVYPTSVDFLRVEIADDLLLDCSTKEWSVISASNYAPISAEIVASVPSGTWSQFWSTIEKEATAYTVASRRICMLFLLMYISGLLGHAMSDSVIVSTSTLVCMSGALIWLCNQQVSASNNIDSAVQAYRDQFTEQGIHLEYRKECDWSWKRIFTRVNGSQRWCLYFFPIPTSVDQIDDV
jgi:hypothetical protein